MKESSFDVFAIGSTRGPNGHYYVNEVLPILKSVGAKILNYSVTRDSERALEGHSLLKKTFSGPSPFTDADFLSLVPIKLVEECDLLIVIVDASFSRDDAILLGYAGGLKKDILCIEGRDAHLLPANTKHLVRRMCGSGEPHAAGSPDRLRMALEEAREKFLSVRPVPAL